MNGYLAGVIGFLCALCTFVCGFYAGWRALAYVSKKTQPSMKLPSLDEMSPEEREETLKEREALLASREAWHSMMNYSADIAYNSANGGGVR